MHHEVYEFYKPSGALAALVRYSLEPFWVYKVCRLTAEPIQGNRHILYTNLLVFQPRNMPYQLRRVSFSLEPCQVLSPIHQQESHPSYSASKPSRIYQTPSYFQQKVASLKCLRNALSSASPSGAPLSAVYLRW